MDHSSHAHHSEDHSSHNHASHDKHAGHSVAMFKDKFWLSLALTVPVLVYSEMIQHWFHFTPPAFFGSEYIPFIFSTIIFLYGGLVFLKSAWGELKSKRPGMMTLISLAIVTAYGYSVATQFWIAGDTFFWELATLVTIMLLGHWLEMASVAKASSALDAMAQLLPDMAERIEGESTKKIPVGELVVGDRILVRPGTRIPADGVIIDGVSYVDESAISGESKPVQKQVGAEVVAGTVNQDGSLTIEVAKTGDDTALAGIMRMVAEAQNSKSQAQALADKAAFALTIIAVLAAVATFAYWLVASDANAALERAVTVLIIACPHALGLAIPLVVSISTAVSARNGLLIRKRAALEAARKIDWVLFDKTGTLTKGEHGVTDVWATGDYTDSDILRITASLEEKSEHIIGRGIVQEAKQKGLVLSAVDNFSALPGVGVKGSLGDEGRFMAVSSRYLVDSGIASPVEFADQVKQAAREGKTEVYLIKGDTAVIGAIALADMVRDESIEAISQLKARGIKTAMVTGDSTDVAQYVAAQLGIDKYFAEARPDDKAKIVKDMQSNGQRVAFVGDGVNDAPALASATVGFAVGAGTDIAIKSADIILVKNDPRDVLRVIVLSKATYSKMVQNLLWAAGYNVFAIPLAAGVFAGAGFVLSPALGAVLMSLSTVVVAINAQLLRRIKLL